MRPIADKTEYDGPILSVAAMRAADAYTIGRGTPSKELMRRAAQGIYDACDVWQGKMVLIVCGSGNNAGDGYALAEILKDAGLDPAVLCLYDRFSEDGAYYLARCREKGVRILGSTDAPADFGAYGVIVDCMLGTGFSGTPREPLAGAIRAVNDAHARGSYVISADINSGLNGDTGQAELAVESDLTVSIGFMKTGFFCGDALRLIGRLVNADIGIELPDELQNELRTEKEAPVQIREFGDPSAPVVLLQPVDEQNLASLDGEAAMIRERAGKDFRLVAFGVRDWNHELSPWKAPAVFGREDFGDGAAATLAKILEYCADRTKTYYIGGYSLAGLFALWAAGETDVFAGVAAASPSVWFPGFTEHLRAHPLRCGRVYLSLGDREEKTRNPVMAAVGKKIRETQAVLTAQHVDCVLEWNEGNHFRDAALRTAKAFAWVLDGTQENT